MGSFSCGGRDEMEVVERGVEDVAVKKKEVERGNKVLVTPLYGVKGA